MPSTTPTVLSPLPELTRARRAIVVVDVVESVRLMQEDEAGFIERWRRFVHQVRTEVLPKHGGRLVKSLGDGMLLEFERVAPAVAAALAMQACARAVANQQGVGTPIPLRIGGHAADVVIDDIDIYGSGVNLAARLGSLADTGEIVISAPMRDEIVPGLDADVEDLGPCWMRHIEKAVHAFRLRPATGIVSPRSEAGQGATPDLDLTIAVLPLSGASRDGGMALLGDFIADGLIAHLSVAPNLRVLSRLSTRTASERGMSAGAIAEHLHAHYAVSGSFAVHGARVAIDIELADTRDGSVAATHRHSAALADLFQAEGEAIAALAAALQRDILQAEALRARLQPLPTIDGYALLAGSIGLIHRVSPLDFERAHAALETLVQRVPRHGSGYAWLAKWHFLRMIRGLTQSPQRESGEARQRIDEALARDPHSAMAWALRGLLHAWDERDLGKAESAYQRSMACNPSEPLAWLYMATLRSWQGRGTEAAASAERALALTPLDPMRYYYESLAAAGMLAAGRLDEAIALSERSLRVHSAHTPTHRVLTIAQMLAGRGDDARRTLQRMRELEPTLTAASYLARYPGGDAPHARLYADALRSAGLPD